MHFLLLKFIVLQNSHKPKLLFAGKSKSFDSCDLLSMQSRATTKQADKLHDIKETSVATSVAPSSCSHGSKPIEDCKECKTLPASSDEIIKLDVETGLGKDVPNESDLQSKKPSESLPKRKIDVITSFTDSPLFTRKHRFGNRNSTDTSSPTFGRRNEHGFNLYKQLTEGRWRRKEAKQTNGTESKKPPANGMNSQDQRLNENRNEGAVKATPVESRASVSLHTQVVVI